MRRSLILRLGLLSAAGVILPALIISVVHRSISSHALKYAIEEQQTEIARRVAAEVNDQIRQAQSLVALVAHSSFFSAGSRVEQYEALHNLLNAIPALQEAMFVSDSGEELVKISQSAARPSLVKRAVDLQHSFIGPPFFSGNRAPTILLAEPVHTYWNPAHRGAVLAKLSFVSLNELLAQAKVGPHGRAFIVNDRGMLLADPDPALVYAHTNLATAPVVKEWLRHPLEPTGFIPGAGGDEGDVALAYPIPLLRSAVVVNQPRLDVYAPIERMRRQFIVYSVLSVVFFLSLTIALAWRILKPVSLLRAAAEEVGKGRRNIELNIRTGDELEELGRTFEQMASSLGELERMRSDLVHMVVHDLKVPLSTILPSLEFLKSGDVGKMTPEQGRFVDMAMRSGQEMLMMVQNLLDVAKMEDGKMSLQTERFLPSDWANAVVHNFRPLAEAGRKELSLSIPKELPPVLGDLGLLNRVLGNLLMNALRHVAPDQGEVSVTVYRDAGFLAVEVRDNGEGIAEEDQQRIFERYTQGTSQKRPMRWGTGLGLTFCKLVVEAHGGRIHFFSQSHIGTVFTFRLPGLLENLSPPPAAVVEEPALHSSVA